MRLLRSAGLAVNALTSSASGEDNQPSGPSSVALHKASFTDATSEYFSCLSSIDVGLRRQVYALEEANIISAEKAAKESPSKLGVPTTFPSASGYASSTSGLQSNKERSGLGAGSLGLLDVGWLNSRNDRVGKEMEAELWSKAEDLIRRLENGREKKKKNEEAHIDMEGDQDISDGIT